MARRKQSAAPVVRGRNYGRERIMVMNGKGKRRMMWRDEFEAGK